MATLAALARRSLPVHSASVVFRVSGQRLGVLQGPGPRRSPTKPLCKDAACVIQMTYLALAN